MKSHISAPITPLRDLRPDVPACIENVVMRALEKDPSRRFINAQQMEDALVQAARDARGQRQVFGAPSWSTGAEPMYASGAPLTALDLDDPAPIALPEKAANVAARLPEAVWVRLMWAVFALNVMLAMTLLCVFVLHLAM